MKKIYFKLLCALLGALILIGLSACTPREGQDKNDDASDIFDAQAQPFDYSTINIDDYVKSLVYKGHTVKLPSESASREDAVWQAIIKTAEISAFPDGAVKYYFEQTKKYYLYLVDGDVEQYELLLSSRNITEENMMDEAEDMVKDDLVYHYILKKENIVLTDTEKLDLFDKYVQKYVEEYGYKGDYVFANMSGLIYESMLYDKTMEYLLLSNEFEIAE